VNAPAQCRLDTLPADELRTALAACCSSDEWVRRMLHARPYGTDAAAVRAADAAWPALDDPDWLDAFQGGALRQLPPGDDGTTSAIVVALELFRERFGYPFVIAAAGVTGEELLMRVRIRLGLEPDAQMRASRAELRRVALARLQQLLGGDVVTPVRS
jgi:2-oxo-4-hydroxy-4-carboxy-5-ureidoimidazoline decarboxylase